MAEPGEERDTSVTRCLQHHHSPRLEFIHFHPNLTQQISLRMVQEINPVKCESILAADEMKVS